MKILIIVLFLVIASVVHAEDYSGTWNLTVISHMWIQDYETGKIKIQDVNREFSLDCKLDWSDALYKDYICRVEETRPSIFSCDPRAYADMTIQEGKKKVIATLYADVGCQTFSIPFRFMKPNDSFSRLGITWEFCNGFGFGKGTCTLTHIIETP